MWLCHFYHIYIMKELLIKDVEIMHCWCDISIQTTKYLLEHAHHDDTKKLFEYGLVSMQRWMWLFEELLALWEWNIKCETSNALNALCLEARNAADTIQDPTHRDITMIYKYRNMCFYAQTGYEYYELLTDAVWMHELSQKFAQAMETIMASHQYIRWTLKSLIEISKQ